MLTASRLLTPDARSSLLKSSRGPTYVRVEAFEDGSINDTPDATAPDAASLRAATFLEDALASRPIGFRSDAASLAWRRRHCSRAWRGCVGGACAAFLVAPMEAEAQCAALEADGIVDGVVTEACQIAET